MNMVADNSPLTKSIREKRMINSLKSAAFGAALAIGLVGSASAQELKFFTIGTGGTAYTYYPVGGVIANAISKPPGSRECGDGGSCGVEGLIASAVYSRGSVDNVNAIISGLRNSGFAQSDVAYWAYTGTGTMEGSEPATDLRTIAALFEEHIHLVALADSGINSVADLKGKRVSLDEPGSGTYVDANLIMEANGLTADDVTAEALKGGAAAEALRNGKIDAFFVVAGYPTGSLVELASAADIKLVPIDGEGAAALTEKYGFFASSDIPEGTYEGVAATTTVAVGAQWFTSAKEDEELIYNITKALWNDETRKLLDVGHAKGKTITPETALNGVGVPLHAGAERFYKEAGLLK
jgi:TRAP transporter TAXI family solute receptor